MNELLPLLTSDQWDKIKRGWVWCKGHTAFWRSWHKDRAVLWSKNNELQSVRYVRPVLGGIRCDVEANDGHTWRALSQDLIPDLNDDVTADGMLRTVRSMWEDEKAFILWSLSGKWKVYVTINDTEHVFEGSTERAALLAAILAAPEPQSATGESDAFRL